MTLSGLSWRRRIKLVSTLLFPSRPTREVWDERADSLEVTGPKGDFRLLGFPVRLYFTLGQLKGNGKTAPPPPTQAVGLSRFLTNFPCWLSNSCNLTGPLILFISFRNGQSDASCCQSFWDLNLTKHKQNNKLQSKRSELTEIWFCVVAKFPFDKIIGRFKLFLSETFSAAVLHDYDPSLLSEYESRISGLFCFVLPTQRKIGVFLLSKQLR